MSECVVRMEMPMNYCEMSVEINGVGDWCPIMAGVCDYNSTKKMPDWCPIICQLPEGHGRLIDADALERHVYTEWVNGELSNSEWIDFRQWLKDEPTVEPSSPWHRVEDELPPKATWVLTVATDGNVKIFNIATVDAGGQWWTCSPQNILRELYGVRYWMPIEPPKEDMDGERREG